jgi:hypothetical protein
MRLVRLQAAHAHRTFSWLARTKAGATWSTRLATQVLPDAGVSSAFSRTAHPIPEDAAVRGRIPFPTDDQ